MNNLNVYKKMGIMLPAMFLLLLFTIIAAVALGAVYVPLGRSFRIILDNIGLIDDPALPQEQVSIIFRVRLPRVIVACVAGAALSACGAVMQGLFRNPMADPGVLGVSSGAGLGAIIAITTGFAARSIYTMPLFAAVGALCTVTLIYLLALRKGKIAPLTLILSGIAVSTFIGAVTQFILIRSNTYEVRRYVFWTMGGLSGMMWEQVRLITFPVLVLLAVLMMFSRELNLLQLGEEEAQSLGLEPSRTRKLLLLFTSLITAVAISVCGPVSFVGLIVPHMVRLIAGPDHRLLIPASALGGAIFLTGCDILGRLPADGEIHVGIITAILGAPYFLYLLIRTRRVGGAF
ncbi:MAG: iron ABC transporter permease [Acetivibrionales bacterium]|jgi:iron complex transport system permease protein|nr:iron ABC transporter permease [Bacillota bacterium]NLP08556.1 iron ABC transporter permease [Clostridiaceae bacterium]HOA55054.1 iron ABC transporter permease [Clostridiales bacterium]HQD31795.1 iron ABC transporter permease [Clostridiales bacterium]